MTKRSLQDWYYNGDVSYSGKEILNKIGVNDYNCHYLLDLEQILRCEKWASEFEKINSKLSGKRITKITFFTPSFNDSKPDASNYSCALVEAVNSGRWIIIFRPSYSEGEIGSDILINIYQGWEELNGSNPILGVNAFTRDTSFSGATQYPYVCKTNLPSDAKYNPDKYILPLDIVCRIGTDIDHYAIYLGNKQVAHLPGGGKPTQFDTWYTFCNPDSSSSSSFSIFSSSSISSNRTIVRIHPVVPFKRKEDIIRHIAKAISYEYCKYQYDIKNRNCAHLVNRCIFGINISPQVYGGRRFDLENEIIRENNKLD